jgi:hypothetical protein
LKALAKISGPDLDTSIEFTYPNLWAREEHRDWARLRIGAEEREIPLLLSLCRECKGPFGVLYVLVASRLGRDDARYQSPTPMNYEDLELFLYTFQEFFEQDGRHHLWIKALGDGSQFVFDNHNIIYAYGDLDRYERELEAAGFRAGKVEIPAPHAHHYHGEFDSSEDDLFEYCEWKKTPLQPSDTP